MKYVMTSWMMTGPVLLAMAVYPTLPATRATKSWMPET
jgi:hypothetical protein